MSRKGRKVNFPFANARTFCYRGNSMKKLLVSSLLASLFLQQGCISRMIDATHASDDRANYSDYQLKMAAINLEREKAGLKPEPVQTFKQWKGKN